MREGSKDYIYQYKLLFYSSWIILYFIFPSWHLPQIFVSITNKVINVPPVIFISGLLIYFFIAAYILDFYFKTLFVDMPLVTKSADWLMQMKGNIGLVMVCGLSAVLHILAYSPLENTLTEKMSSWIYLLIKNYWLELFGFPIQYPIWGLLFLLVIILTRKKQVSSISDFLHKRYSAYKSSFLIKLFSTACIIGVFILYTQLIPPYSSTDHIMITGDPPLGTLIYLSIYALFGNGAVSLVPAIVQFIFYILSGVFLYRTINLFCEKETALLGSSIYLFSPIIFAYGTFGHIQSGTVFFIIIVSFFFLKFIRDENNKDIILTAYFISAGSLYKREIILMFVICSAYLIAHKIKQKDLRSINHLRVLSLSLISFLPWYFIGTRGADGTVLSHLISLDSLSLYLLMIPSQLSWPIFFLFLLSFIFVLFKKRDHVTLFFGFIFLTYYCLYTSLSQQTVHRYSIAFYPTISVFLAQFIYSVIQKIRWRHAFRLVISILIIYLAILCIIPRSSTNLITFKYTDFESQIFPLDKAAEWVLNETGNDERVLILITGSEWKEMFLRKVKEIPGDKVRSFNLAGLNSLFPSGDFQEFRQNLKDFCKDHKFSYIIFPGGDAPTMYPLKKYKEMEIRKFLEEDKDDDYILSAKFNNDDNYIYIYKLRDEFIDNH